MVSQRKKRLKMMVPPEEKTFEEKTLQRDKDVDVEALKRKVKKAKVSKTCKGCFTFVMAAIPSHNSFPIK